MVEDTLEGGESIRWKVQRSTAKKTWVEQIEDVRNHRLNIKKVRNTDMERLAWKRVMTEMQQLVAPTAAYGLRSQGKCQLGIRRRRRRRIDSVRTLGSAVGSTEDLSRHID